MKVDYIIVGSGLAGILFCEVLRQNEKSFVVFDDNSQQSSTVAGGLYNPVILKRFTPVWRAKEQLELASTMYGRIEEELELQLDKKLPVYRLFTSAEEQNNWFLACDKPGLKDFLSPQLIKTKFNGIQSDFGFGEVLHTGRIDTPHLVMAYRDYMVKEGRFRKESFKYHELTMNHHGVSYGNIEAKQIVFAEGFGLINNPYFNKLPLRGTKGQLLIARIPDLKIDFVVKSGVFLIPLGSDLYIVGATYERDDKTNKVTQEAKQELIRKLRIFMKSDFEIIDQVAGIRPTVTDRKPLVGRNRAYPNLYVLNGLGTRGVMIAPYTAWQLYNCIEHQHSLDPEIDIKRFN